ncbi:MAG TPA: efflux transporter outer membrane subunit [Tepidisphaeraceae bacterium]|nr:efflux transporter outer membrane subunit [Tepidisphaeraceae bacterium]
MGIKWVIFGVVPLMLYGCEVGPNYQRPRLAVPKNYGELSGVSATQPSQANQGHANLAQWWTNFRDPELNSLIARAIKGNLDFMQAASRVRQARYETEMASADIWPTVNADGGYQHARGSKNVEFPISAFEGGNGPAKSSGGGGAVPAAARGGANTSDPPQGSASPAFAVPPPGPQSPLGSGGFPGVSTDLFQLGFDASWEIDVFGGARRGVEAAQAQEAAAIENQRDTLVTLLAEVARNYIELRGYQRQEAVVRQNLVNQRETLRLTQEKARVGVISRLDVAQQAEQLDATSALLPPLIASERQSIHSLSILLGQPPDALSAELSIPAAIPPVPRQVPVGLPSDLLRRRPDIRAAERQLAAATAQIGVATADLFPKFDLTGSAGLDATDPRQLLNWDSRYYSLVPGVSWAIFDAGRIRANIGAQTEAQKQALLAYQIAVLNALKEVDDALAQYNTEQLRNASLAAAVKDGQDALAIAQDQYNRGVTDFLPVLEAQGALLQAQDSLTQSDEAVSEDLVALYKALGGGWEGDATPSAR